MKEFTITNITTKETNIIFGYDAPNAFKRAKLNEIEWLRDWVEYID